MIQAIANSVRVDNRMAFKVKQEMRFYLDSQFRAAKQYFLGNHLNASSVPSKPVAYYHIRYRVGNTFFDLHFSAAGIVSCAWWLCALRV